MALKICRWHPALETKPVEAWGWRYTRHGLLLGSSRMATPAEFPEITKRLSPGLRMLQEGVTQGHSDMSGGGRCQEITQNKAKRRQPQSGPLTHRHLISRQELTSWGRGGMVTAGPRGEKPIYSPYNELHLREDGREGDASAGLSVPTKGAVVSRRAGACATASSAISRKWRLLAPSCLCAQLTVTTPPR